LHKKDGERAGNSHGAVFHYGTYMLLESEQGNKRTSCLDAARYLAGIFSFEQVGEIIFAEKTEN
jgi:hypothetical protein